MFITIALILGLSNESFAGTGGAKDGLELLLVVIGFMLIIFVLLTGIDYLKKNGKTLTHKTITFLKKMIVSLKDLLQKIKSDYFDLSYF
jgi:hypothetical protein